jgi:hypothetical protein
MFHAFKALHPSPALLGSPSFSMLVGCAPIHGVTNTSNFGRNEERDRGRKAKAAICRRPTSVPPPATQESRCTERHGAHSSGVILQRHSRRVTGGGHRVTL